MAQQRLLDGFDALGFKVVCSDGTHNGQFNKLRNI